MAVAVAATRRTRKRPPPKCLDCHSPRWRRHALRHHPRSATTTATTTTDAAAAARATREWAYFMVLGVVARPELAARSAARDVARRASAAAAVEGRRPSKRQAPSRATSRAVSAAWRSWLWRRRTRRTRRTTRQWWRVRSWHSAEGQCRRPLPHDRCRWMPQHLPSWSSRRGRVTAAAEGLFRCLFPQRHPARPGPPTPPLVLPAAQPAQTGVYTRLHARSRRQGHHQRRRQ